MNKEEASLNGKNSTGLCNGKTSGCGGGGGTIEVLMLWPCKVALSSKTEQQINVPQNTWSWVYLHEVISPLPDGEMKASFVDVWSWGKKFLLIHDSAVSRVRCEDFSVFDFSKGSSFPWVFEVQMDSVVYSAGELWNATSRKATKGRLSAEGHAQGVWDCQD